MTSFLSKLTHFGLFCNSPGFLRFFQILLAYIKRIVYSNLVYFRFCGSGDAGMNAHLGKPLEMDKVVSTIAACRGKANTTQLPRPWGSFFDCI